MSYNQKGKTVSSIWNVKSKIFMVMLQYNDSSPPVEQRVATPFKRWYTLLILHHGAKEVYIHL